MRMEDITCLIDEQMWAELQEFVQLELVPFYWPEDHGYGAQQNEGQQHQGPTAEAPNIEEVRSFTTLLDAQYWPSQIPGPSTIGPIPNVAPQWIELQTIDPLAITVPAMTFDGIPVYTPEGHTAPTFGVENGNDLVPPVQTAPPVKAPVSQKVKKPRKKKVAEGPYVKKPLNAFMLFLKEHRKSAEEELGLRTSAAVNKLLGQRWKSLSAKAKENFTVWAEMESLLHAVEHPDWTSKTNYGNKRKRSRTKV
ncbi:transcription factor 7-like 2 [Gouania willdenowi]|uniref:transcription factor 7-like 2 n=1 Tax=Gouania willdenowi TaxID=441366 RepID=UPI001056781E|nr:transcription factor 7-like 2 [Gouania willdenowi]